MFLENNMNKLVILFVIGIILLVGINFYKTNIGAQPSVVLSVVVIIVCGYFGYILINDENVLNNQNVEKYQNNEINEAFNDYESESPIYEEYENNEEVDNEQVENNEEIENYDEIVDETPETNVNNEEANLEQFQAEALLPNSNVEGFQNPTTASHDEVNPNTPGNIATGTLLNAGHHVGVNTTGCSMRNANRGLRSEPPNPQTQVSPWLNTTICPDLYRKPLDSPN